MRDAVGEKIGEKPSWRGREWGCVGCVVVECTGVGGAGG